MSQQGHSSGTQCLQVPFISGLLIIVALVWFIEGFLLGKFLTCNCLGNHTVNAWRQWICSRDELRSGAQMIYILYHSMSNDIE